MNKQKHPYKFVTTTLPYVNSKPHIGHALEFFQAIVLVTKLRSLGHQVFFNLGLDEHGQKVYEQAVKMNLTPKEFCDQQAVYWKEFLERFNIKYDNFYRTTDEEHYKKVQQFWLESLANGDLYKAPYIGKYCVGCESYKLDKDLVDGKCPDHNVEPKLIEEEENWFFRITKYRDSLLKWLDESPDFLYPKYKIEELRNQILQINIDEQEDLSVSRLKEKVSWGVPVPNDPDHVVYVWFDALLNYIFAAQDSPLFFWENCETIQLCGPDNLRFQGCIFQSFLASRNLPHTDRLLVHGTVLDAEGKKMSKSLGNVVDPIDQLEKYGLDAVKYYAVAGLTTFGDGKWSEKELVELYNSDLANNYGNLLSRVVHLVSTKEITIDPTLVEPSFVETVDSYIKNSEACWNRYDIHAAIREIMNLVSWGNKYMNDEQPWKSESGNIQLNNLYHLLNVASHALFPVIPDKAVEAISSLQEKKKIVLFSRIEVK